MIRTTAVRALCAASILLLPVAARAELPGATPSPAPEIVHTVTSDRTETTLHNATRTTFVVTRDDIERNGYRTVGDALATIPGVEIERYGTIGKAVSYGIRGSSSAQVLVLIDGQPAPGELANSVQFGTISTTGVRRIEVVEGGGSTLYGSGAIGGIINIISEGSGAQPYARASLGTFNDREVSVGAHGFSFERIVANNAFAVPPSSSGGFANPTTLGNSDFTATTLAYGGDHRVGTVDAGLRVSLQSDHIGAPGFFPYLSSTSREDDVNLASTLELSHESANANTTLQLGGDRQQIAFGCNAANDANCYLSSQSLSTEARSFASLRNVVGVAASRTVYGIDLSRGVVRVNDGNGDPIAANALAQAAAYVQHTWLVRGGSVYAGLRGERDGALGGEISPSLGWRGEAGAVTLRANAATAFRAPNASELYFPGYGNASLVAERARVGDLSVEDTHVLGGARLGWFTNDTRNLIVAVPDAKGNYHPQNVDRAKMQGFTLDVASRPLHGVTARLSVTDLYRANDVTVGTRLPNDPVFSTALHVEIAPNRASAFAGAGFAIAAQGVRGSYDPTQPTFYQSGAYSTLDAYARLRLAPHALVTLRGYNLGNERYAQVAGYPMPGRTFVLELGTR